MQPHGFVIVDVIPSSFLLPSSFEDSACKVTCWVALGALQHARFWCVVV